jgi:hypothetical protein
MDIDDPVVYWVIVRDEHVCGECVRLHMLPDGVTPRCWYLSEVGHGYHKKGQDNPKVGGLHPHCRCSMVTLLPGYGFSASGNVAFISLNHDEVARQRGVKKSETDLNKMSQPTPTFPKMGLGDDRRETPYVTTKEQLYNKVNLAAASNALDPRNQDVPKSYMLPRLKDHASKKYRSQVQGMSGTRGETTSGATPVQTGYARAGDVAPGGWQSSPDEQTGTKLHEDLHLHFNRVERKFGTPGRQTLARNLYNAIPVQFRGALDEYQRQVGSESYGNSPIEHEEKLARLLNYMNSRGDRAKFHDSPNQLENEAYDKGAFDLKMKGAYKALRAASEVADDTWATHEKTHLMGRSETADDEPLEKGLKQHQLMGMLKQYGWVEKGRDGKHIHMEHPVIGAKVPFQHGHSGDYDRNWASHHLAQAGLKFDSRGGAVPDPKHAFFSKYVEAGHAQASAPQPKTWSAADATTSLPIDQIDLGGAIDGKSHAAAVSGLKGGMTSLPAVEVMDTGDGRYGTLGNHHLLQAARDTGMTHVPVKLVKTEKARRQAPKTRRKRSST